MNDIIQALQQAGYFLAAHVIEILLGAGILYVRRWTGIQIDEKHMRTLHSAAMTGVRLAIEGNLDGNRLRETAVAYIRESVPDAVRRLTGGDDSILGKLVQAKLQEVLQR